MNLSPLRVLLPVIFGFFYKAYEIRGAVTENKAQGQKKTVLISKPSVKGRFTRVVCMLPPTNRKTAKTAIMINIVRHIFFT